VIIVSPQLPAPYDARYCLPLYHIAFVIKMVNKENVKNYLNRRQG
jgi:hypothetical protein